ncbi:MAG TPA: hypothetical protein VFU82_08945 [Gammaproteobacteria bacterium]|nr:hypothetical protein [Gammaproteobacteria bacterium]
MTETIDLLKPSNQVSTHASVRVPVQINASECDHISDSVLSLFDVITFDCFDTLLWRNADKPIDVFYALQHQPTFKKMGFTADLRMKCEEIARRRQWVRRGSREVNLRDIYLTFCETLTDDDIQQLSNEEIQQEMALCYPFLPMIDVLKRALALNKKVSIVSDTYLRKEQLMALLSHHLGKSVVDCLHGVLVSCEFGASKSDGLHKNSVAQHKKNTILHIGDHEVADVIAARSAGVSAIHFKQQHETIKTLSRLRANTLSLFDARIREQTPMFTPYKTLLSQFMPDTNTPETTLGYAVLGPLMVAFAADIQEKVKSLSHTSKPVKVLFLLRDGHLPYQVYQTLYSNDHAKPVRISRFASFAASFCDVTNIENYLSEMIMGDRYEDMAKQLLFTQQECHQILNQMKNDHSPQQRFIKLMLTKSNINLIIERSQQYRDRLMRYLKKEANVEHGDTLLLIDLGYSGTTQTKLAPIFKSAYQITLLGHYLLSLSTPAWRGNRSGLLDPSVCDENTLQTLVTYIALLEQLCTTTDKSVVDFDESGSPIYGDSNINQDQHDVLTRIQSATVNFAEEVKAKHSLNTDACMRHQVALGELGRLLFFPTMEEMNLLQTFKFDLNLGTSDVFEMFDAEKGLNSLRERGMFFMEKNLKNMRTNYPAELRYASLSSLLTLVTQHRHRLTLNHSEMSFRRYPVTVIALKKDKSATEVIEASPTFDGYFSLMIPIGQGDYFLGLNFGENTAWLQLHSVTLIPVYRWNTDQESLHSTDIQSNVILEAMTDHGHGLLHCDSPGATLLIKPLEKISNEIKMVRVVFRPIN